MRSQSSYVMGQLTLRWNLMKNVKLKGGNLILCSVRYQYLFAGFQYLCVQRGKSCSTVQGILLSPQVCPLSFFIVLLTIQDVILNDLVLC